jgi:phage terminase large subunit-like protein
MPTIDITLPPLHTGQRPIAGHPARFRVLGCGRRWGKTRLGAALCIAEALEGRRAWWVAPSYPVANVGWRLIRRMGVQIPGADIRQVDRLITMPTGGEVQVRSADNPDSLRGEGLDFVVLDECAFIKEDAWLEAIRPALSDREGRAMFISTPKGRNWFWRAFQQGLDPKQTEWASWQLPTSDNPHINPAEIEAARHGLPERVFRQEYLAEFLEDAGGVFRRVMEAATAVSAQPETGRQYVFGVDWGQSNDFTVIAVMDTKSKAMCHLDRFNQIDYAVQRGRLMALYEQYRPVQVIAETNAMGQPIIEELQRQGAPISPFTTTNATKTAAIDALALAFEQGTITILPDPVLIGELQAYEQDKLPSGLRRFGAPQGMHDDTVMALAMAWQGCTSGPVLYW